MTLHFLKGGYFQKAYKDSSGMFKKSALFISMTVYNYNY